MASILIQNLGPIHNYYMEIEKFNLLIGEQATGKSTISKCIYFFRTIKNELVEYLYNYATEKNYARGKEQQFPRALNRVMKDIFVQLFGFSWDLDSNLHLEFKFTDEVQISVTLEEGARGKKYIGIKYSDFLIWSIKEFESRLDNFYQESNDLSFNFASLERARLHRDILEMVNNLFNDYCETYYIPAGRQLLTLISSQKTKLDYDSIDLVNRKFMQFNESIQSKFVNGISNAHKFYPVSDRKFDVGRIANDIKTGLKGDYRLTSAGERLVLKDGEQILVNFASSGQQELLWLYNQLFILMLRQEPAFVIIEEPEAHLYPTLQKDVIEFISQFTNINNSKVLVTTHSPYVLTSANVLYYAGTLGKTKNGQVSHILAKEKWISPDTFVAWKLENINGNTQAESLVDEDTHELRTSLIDDVSDEIGKIYTKLYYAEVDDENT